MQAETGGTTVESETGALHYLAPMRGCMISDMCREGSSGEIVLVLLCALAGLRETVVVGLESLPARGLVDNPVGVRGTFPYLHIFAV
jgi:hypothetical protein